MRIKSLEIRSSWKNLSNFRIDLDQRRDVAVLIGRNGSAKSNLLEAIITIFQKVDLDDPPPFSYDLKYEIEGSIVILNAEEGKQPKAEVNGAAAPMSEIRDKFLPRHVVSYYSGSSDRFAELFRKHDLMARDETLVPAKRVGVPGKLPFRRFVYAQPVHGLFALLAFYFSDDKLVESFLKELPRIEAFDSALLVVRKPRWARKGQDATRFWGAKGPVRDLLERIRTHCLVPFTRSIRVDLDIGHKETRELMYLYLPDLNALRAFATQYGRDPRALFQALDTMRLSGLIDDFRVRVRVSGSASAIHTRQLSEGEQQLLTVLGLMRFTRDESSIYLLDEPDTHLNPAWSIEYLDRLRKIGELDRNSHTIIATHDPLLAAGLCKEEIRVLTRTPTGQIVAATPDESPRGRGVASVLTSPLYGLQSQLDPFSLRVLKRIYEVSFWKAGAKRKRHLSRLRALVPVLQALESSPDPYRNIARDAFRIAQDEIVKSGQTTGVKTSAVEQLAKKLYEESSKETK